MCQYRLVSVLLANAAELVAQARREFEERNPESRRLHEEAVKVLPGGHTRTVLAHEPFALTFVRSDGAVLTDADGHEYVDLLGDYTAGLLDSEGARARRRAARDDRPLERRRPPSTRG